MEKNKKWKTESMSFYRLIAIKVSQRRKPFSLKPLKPPNSDTEKVSFWTDFWLF